MIESVWPSNDDVENNYTTDSYNFLITAKDIQIDTLTEFCITCTCIWFANIYT